MSTERQIFLNCVRVADMSARMITEGTTVTNCCDCKCEVYISKSSVEAIKENGAKPICDSCCTMRVAECGGYYQLPMTDAQKNEALTTARRIFRNN